MSPQRSRRILPAVVVAVCVLAACAPGAAPGASGTGAPAWTDSRSATGVGKTLRLGMLAQYEPNPGFVLFATGGSGFPQHNFLVHAGLTSYDAQESLIPWVATTVPSIEAGDWQLLPDGRMDVTWKLREGVRWQDGTPLEA